MRKLIGRLLLLLVPPVSVVYGFPGIVLMLSGELYPVERVVRLQADNERLVLYGPSYTNTTTALKMATVASRAAPVVALGSSRVMQFRSQMFKDSRSFYNAGGAVGTIWDFRPRIEQVPLAVQPAIVIIGLDQYLFNDRYQEFSARPAEPERGAVVKIEGASGTIYKDYWAGKFTLADLFRPGVRSSRIGLNAIVNDNGFRNDGSYNYGDYIAGRHTHDTNESRFGEVFDRIDRGTQRFEYGPHVSQAAVDEARAILELCSRRGIHVVGILPAFAHAVYAKMASMGDRYGYLGEIMPALRPVFQAHGASLFDFSDLAAVGADDRETIDGYHASERAHLRMLLLMSESDPTLAQYVAPSPYLRARLADSDPYLVFGDGER